MLKSEGKGQKTAVHLSRLERLHRAAGVAAIVLGTAFGVTEASATTLGTNLIVNAGGEANVGADFNNVVAPSGWTTTGNFSAVRYAVGGSADLNNADSAAVGGGLNYFAGGPSNGLSSARQTISFADLAISVDSGAVTAAFQALIGGYFSQGDNMVIEAVFRDALLNPLLTLDLGPVTPAERGNQSQLLARSTNGMVPVGARSVDIIMTSTRQAGAYNDGYADNLSLVLRGGNVVEVPAPASLPLLGAALATLAAVRRRRT